MPKVTKEHVEARRAQIMNAAGICFAQKGFQKTTIKDICKKAGLSTGAVYGYYKSKADIIQALSDENVRQNKEEFARFKQHGNLRDALKGFMDILLYFKECEKVAADLGVNMYKMRVSLWAEVVRNPEVMRVDDIYHGTISGLQKAVRRAQKKGELDKSLDTKAVAQILMSLLEGFTLQEAIGGGLNTDKYISNVMTMLESGMLVGRKPRRAKR